MSRSKKATAPKLRIVDGQKGEAPPVSAIPSSVALDPVATAKWKEIVGVLEEKGIDATATINRLKLESTCLAWSEFLRATAALREHGQSYETYNQAGGLMIRKRPEVDVANAFLGHYRQFLKILDILPPSGDGNDEDPASKYLTS